MPYMDDYKHLQIQLKDLKAATNDFNDKPIGRGAFGNVYRAELFLEEKETMVAAKRLNRKGGQGDIEFWNETTILSELNHENLARLLHICTEGDELILIYKYESRGSLDQYLGNAGLTWTQRLNICIGAAIGIAYLHDPNNTQQSILHRDIKSANILLDHNWTAKVSDFGLSKYGPANLPRTYFVSDIAGTPGYCDPDYWKTGFLSKECDVYSFGVVLFEVMCGRVCFELDKQRIKIVVGMWRRLYKEKKLDDIIFPHLKEKTDQKSLLTFAAVADRCLLRHHKDRPSMVEIVKELKIALDHQQKFHDQHIPDDAMMPVSADISGENLGPASMNMGTASFIAHALADGENINQSGYVRPGYGYGISNPPSMSDIFATNQSDTFSVKSYMLKPNDYLKYGLSLSRVGHSNHSRPSGGEALSVDDEINQADYVGISLVGKKFKEVNPTAYYVEKDDDDEINQADYVGISLVGKKFKEVNPTAYYVEKDDDESCY